MISFPWISNEIFYGYWNSLWKNFFYNYQIYCNVNTVVTNMKNIESSTDSDSSNEMYNINNNDNKNNSNSIVNNDNILIVKILILVLTIVKIIVSSLIM